MAFEASSSIPNEIHSILRQNSWHGRTLHHLKYCRKVYLISSKSMFTTFYMFSYSSFSFFFLLFSFPLYSLPPISYSPHPTPLFSSLTFPFPSITFFPTNPASLFLSFIPVLLLFPHSSLNPFSPSPFRLHLSSPSPSFPKPHLHRPTFFPPISLYSIQPCQIYISTSTRLQSFPIKDRFKAIILTWISLTKVVIVFKCDGTC